MAKVILSTGETYTVAAGNTAELFGTAGAENITIQAGANVVLDASFNQGGDTLVLDGNAGDYTMQVAGTTVTLTDANGNTIQVPAGAVGADVQFADGTRQLIIDTTAGAVKLGDDVVTADPTTPTGSSTGGAGGNADQSFALTSGADDFEGGAGDDTFTATALADSAGGGNLVDSLQDVDILDGGAGTDTLNITFANASSPAATFQNIENVDVRFTAGAMLDLTNTSGVDAVTVAASTDTGTVTGIAAGTAVSAENSVQDINLEYANTVLAGAADTVALSVEDFGTSTTAGGIDIDDVSNTGNVVEGLTVAATGDNVVDLSGAGTAVETLTVTGSGSLEVAVDDTALATVDASAATGALTIDLNGSTVDLTVTGGSAADEITVGSGDDTVNTGAGDDTLTFGANLDTNDTIDGGEGTDILAITGNLAAATISNFETLQMTTGVSNTADMDAGDFDTYNFVSAHAAHDVTVNNYLDENLVVDSETALATLVVTQKDVTDTDIANVTVNNSGNDGTDGDESTTTLASLTATSAETINLTLSTDNANFDESATVAVATIATTDAALVIDGNAVAILGAGTALTNESINAAAATGALTITLGAADQAVTTGTADDTIAIDVNGDASDTIDGGAGDDLMTVTVADGTSEVSAVTTNVETVALTMTATDAGTASFDASNLTGVTTLAVAAAVSDAGDNGAETIAITGLNGSLVSLFGNVTEINGDATVSLALETATGSSDTITVQLTSDNEDTTEDTVASQTVDILSIADVETVTINVDSGIDTVTTTTITTLDLDDTDTTSLTLAGTSTTGAVVVTAMSNDSAVTSIDASTLTGDLTLGELGTGGITLQLASVDNTSSTGTSDTKYITLDSTDTATDTIQFGATVGDVSISNFTANNSVVADVLDLSAFGITSSADLVFTVNALDVEITTTADDNFDTITLLGVTPGALTDANFVYA